MAAENSSSVERITRLPAVYRLFFLWTEPISTVLGAIYAHFLPQVYLELTHAASAPSAVSGVPVGTKVALTQLGNLYLAFAIVEALVLRSTNDLGVWRVLLLGLLIGDFGHLYSVWELGSEGYWKFWAWNSINWGNVGFVYCVILLRIAFLCGVGIKSSPDTREAVRKKTR